MTMGESRQPFAKIPAMRLVGSRLLAGIFLVAVCGAASPAAAAPGLGRPGYTLSKVSAAVPATGIAQLAFRPGDTTHVYAARVSGSEILADRKLALTGTLIKHLFLGRGRGRAVSQAAGSAAEAAATAA